MQRPPPAHFFKCLSDETRLNATLLIRRAGDLCVCELMAALEDSQPKISRHLAQLRSCSILVDVRRGQWVYYQLNPELPQWLLNVLDETGSAEQDNLDQLMKNLENMPNRPSCC